MLFSHHKQPQKLLDKWDLGPCTSHLVSSRARFVAPMSWKRLYFAQGYVWGLPPGYDWGPNVWHFMWNIEACRSPWANPTLFLLERHCEIFLAHLVQRKIKITSSMYIIYLHNELQSCRRSWTLLGYNILATRGLRIVNNWKKLWKIKITSSMFIILHNELQVVEGHELH